MYEEKKSACITTYTRAPKKQPDFTTEDIPVLVVSGLGAFLGYGLWIVSIILGVNPW